MCQANFSSDRNKWW